MKRTTNIVETAAELVAVTLICGIASVLVFGGILLLVYFFAAAVKAGAGA